MPENIAISHESVVDALNDSELRALCSRCQAELGRHSVGSEMQVTPYTNAIRDAEQDAAQSRTAREGVLQLLEHSGAHGIEVEQILCQVAQENDFDVEFVQRALSILSGNGEIVIADSDRLRLSGVA